MISVFDLIAQTETKRDLHAIRFEPAKYASLINGPMLPAHAQTVYKIQAVHKCSLGTAKAIYCTSYGAVQIMGFNLWGVLGCNREFYDFLTSLDLQQSMFQSFLKTFDLDHYSLDDLVSDHHARLDFSIKYNGSIVYEQALLQAIKELGLIAK